MGRRRRKSSSCWSRFAARCRTRCSASLSCRRYRTGRDRTAPLLRKAVATAHDAGLASSRTASGCCRTARFSQSNFWSTSRRFEPHHAPYIKNLGTLGIEATLRIVDAVQYRARVEDFDFDMTMERLSMSATPGDAMRPYLLVAGGRHQGIVQSRRHRQSRDRCADRKDHRRRQPDRSDHRLPRASTACSAPAAIGCRNGIAPITRSPIGMCSIIRAVLPRYQFEIIIQRRGTDSVVV